MYRFYPISWVVGLSIMTGVFTAAPAGADSFSDITGTNIWNRISPRFSEGELDPKLVQRILRLNEESEEAFRACNDAIAQVEQTPVPPPRYARQPSTPVNVVPPACQRLEELRIEIETLRTSLAQDEGFISNPAFQTW